MSLGDHAQRAATIDSAARAAQGTLLASAVTESALLAWLDGAELASRRARVSRWIEGVDDAARSEFFSGLVERLNEEPGAQGDKFASRVVLPILVEWLKSPNASHGAIARNAIWMAFDCDGGETALRRLAKSDELIDALKLRSMREMSGRGTRGYGELVDALDGTEAKAIELGSATSSVARAMGIEATTTRASTLELG